MPVRKGAAARFLGEEIDKLAFQARFLHTLIAKQRKQSQQDETTIEKQKATIKKLKAELKASKAMKAMKSTKAKKSDFSVPPRQAMELPA